MNYFANLQWWCKRAYERVKHRLPSGDTNYAFIPEKVRIKNSLSNSAYFDTFKYRRRGYIAIVPADEFVQLGKLRTPPISSERYIELMDAWLRGVIWSPIIVQAEVTPDGWVINRVRDFDIAVFLARKGQRTITVQVMENPDKPATKENLSLLKGGIANRRGDTCQVLFARITY